MAAAAGRLLRSHARLQVLGLRRCLTGKEGIVALTSGALPADYRSAATGTSGHGFLWRADRLRLELQQSRLGPGGSIPLSNALRQAERDRTQGVASFGSHTRMGLGGHHATELDLELG